MDRYKMRKVQVPRVPRWSQALISHGNLSCFFCKKECVFFIRDSLVWPLKANPQTNCSELKVSNRIQPFGVSNSGCFQLKMKHFSGAHSVHVVPS